MADKIMEMIRRSIWVVGWFAVLIIYILLIVILSPFLFLYFLANGEY